MSKRGLPKAQSSKRRRSPSSAKAAGEAGIQQSREGDALVGEALQEGEAIILPMGAGAPRASPLRQRRALIATANSGDANAQSRLGDVYREGDGLTAKDYAEAVRWYGSAAGQGDANAQNNLGSMYFNGIGVPEDQAAAVRCYRLAAEQGLAVAQYNLGIALAEGAGVAEDPLEAAKWLEQAADGGYAFAQTEWGVRLRFGRGVPKDVIAAAEFFIRAARQGDIPAVGNLCDIKAELQESAMGGNTIAAQRLMEMFRHGFGVPKDRKTSNRWGKLWARLESAASPSHLEQVFTREGALAYRMWDDFIERAPGDDLYSLEWWYRNSTVPENITDHLSRVAYVKYKAERDAGTPSPF